MSGRELRKCHYCKKNRLACMFMMVKPHKRKMCNLCQVNARKGRKHCGTKWKGYRISETPEYRKIYALRHKKKAENRWYEAWLAS